MGLVAQGKKTVSRHGAKARTIDGEMEAVPAVMEVGEKFEIARFAGGFSSFNTRHSQLSFYRFVWVGIRGSLQHLCGSE